MKLLEWAKKNADKLATIPNALEVLEALAAVGDNLGNTFLADDNKVPNYIPKSRFDEVIGQKNMQKEQIDEITKQMENFKTSATEADKLKKQIEKLQESAGENEDLKKQIANLSKTAEQVNSMQTTIQELETKNNDWNTKYNDTLVKSRAQVSAMTAGAKNPESLLKLLDLSKVKLEGDNIVGLDDQITALKQSDGYLFSEPTPGLPGAGGNFPRPGGSGSGTQFTEEALRNMTPEQINQNWAAISTQMQAGQLPNK